MNWYLNLSPTACVLVTMAAAAVAWALLLAAIGHTAGMDLRPVFHGILFFACSMATYGATKLWQRIWRRNP